MFIVINKSKIISYSISLFAILILFFTTAGLNYSNTVNAIETSSNIIDEEKINNEIDNYMMYE